MSSSGMDRDVRSFDVVHPAFSLPTEASSTFRGALRLTRHPAKLKKGNMGTVGPRELTRLCVRGGEWSSFRP